jgi:hypothetical protein
MKSIAPRTVIWTDPSDWMGMVVPNLAVYTCRTFGEPDDRFLDALIRNFADTPGAPGR